MVAQHGLSTVKVSEDQARESPESRKVWEEGMKNQSDGDDNAATHPSTSNASQTFQHSPSSSTSTTTRTTPPLQKRHRRRIHPLVRWIRLLLFAASIGRIAATNIEVRELSDTEYVNQTSGLALAASGDQGFFVPVIPLTKDVGFGMDEEFLKTVDLAGKLDLYTSDKRGVSLKDSSSLAYLACEGPSSFNSTALFNTVLQLEFAAVILYTTTPNHYCIITGPPSPIPVFTSISPSSASSAFKHLDTTFFIPSATIRYHSEYKESAASTTGQSNTAAVALFVLYAFTGVLGSAFIAVLAIGTWRAHRHPDRYGPRATAMHGRPRQSRAKGLARAVLDTIPIVHFNIAGNVESSHYPVLDRKPGDIEMARPTSQRALTDLSAPSSRAETMNSEHSVLANHQRPLTIHEADAITETPSPLHTPPPAEQDDASPLGPTGRKPSVVVMQKECSICQELFEKGQQLRVLPCRHGFHQGCIDPWLLNSSGSCPLCRIDLRPEDARQSFQMPPPPAPGEIPPHNRGRSAVPELGISRLVAHIKRQRQARRGEGEPSVPEEAAGRD
ncbi:hypothetical protein BJ508DRAFT_325682 [Ascobolus immersus RN42]|uniref:RING-type domain-containing protein n=1 Tax=Ascobolus immersus RN42 TaxID=1160509 RepID=A0A3N4I9K1_ASCIM|nr:hypothetical protein BJ508DRAFT_325682 [Ascobolus immersus RN42]